MKYGYIRVSTRRQRDKGNSLEAQFEAVNAAGAEKIFTDTYTRKTLDRPQLKILLEQLQPGDTLIVTKLDRFAGSIARATELITDLIDRGIVVHVLNLGILDNGSTSVLMRNMLLAFAQFERDLIVERTQEGKAIARLHDGYKEGRPRKYRKEQMEHALGLLESHSYKQVEAMTGISKSTLIRAKKELIF